ncbi:unnamed protein product [Porites lobata]|uniref:Uncharacterized protein n=1 Tax=Porites lobata TaxID=104759 RepID=A0ABN8PRH0_9CNID|nr:unnamed protein product [Porites lobata]
MVSPLPLTDSGDIEVFLPFDRHLPQANAVTIHRNVSQLDGNNTKLNSEHALVRQRRAAGCVRSKTVENCNGMLITTVKCKRRSVACLHGTSANCSPVTTYYGRCGRTHKSPVTVVTLKSNIAKTEPKYATERLNKDLHEPRASVIFSTVSAVWFVF